MTGCAYVKCGNAYTSTLCNDQANELVFFAVSDNFQLFSANFFFEIYFKHFVVCFYW